MLPLSLKDIVLPAAPPSTAAIISATIYRYNIPTTICGLLTVRIMHYLNDCLRYSKIKRRISAKSALTPTLRKLERHFNRCSFRRIDI